MLSPILLKKEEKPYIELHTSYNIMENYGISRVAKPVTIVVDPGAIAGVRLISATYFHSPVPSLGQSF